MVGAYAGIGQSPLSSRPKRDVQPMSITGGFDEDDMKRRFSRKNSDEIRWCAGIWREMMRKQHQPFMFPFYQPVDPVALGIPTYFDVVKEPMDLATVKKKLDNGDYEVAEEFESDMRLMFNNCFIFNPPGSDVYVMGKRSESVFNMKWAERPDFSVIRAQKSYRRSKKAENSDSDDDISDSDCMHTHCLTKRLMR
jgi:bromodomain-containing factor 1